MRKIIFAAFFSFMFTLFCMTGCAPESAASEPTQADKAIANEPIITVDEGEISGDESISPIVEVIAPPFFLPLGGINIQLGANIEEIKNAIGEPIAEFRMPSCAFDGTDIVYRFPGIQVHTIPIGDANYIHTISLMDDTVSTSEGIMLGSNIEELISVYGYDYVWEYGMYTFTREHTSISFFVDDGMVIAITYELDVNLFFEVGG